MAHKDRTLTSVDGSEVRRPACDCSGNDEFCERCNPALAPRVFCRNCSKAIFPSVESAEAVDDRFGWVHVSTHSGACPQSFAQPAEPDRAAPLTRTLELIRIVERMLTERDEAAKSEQAREQLG